MRLDPLTPTFASVVSDLDLRAPDDDPVWDRLRAALLERRLLVVRAPGLGDDEHERAMAHLGPIAAEGLDEPRRVTHVSNVRPDGSLGGGAISWHLDYGFFPHPYEAISLYGSVIPPGGTETRFVDAVDAAATLPPGLRARIEGLTARHVVDVAVPEREAVVRVRKGRLDDSYPHAVRPVLWRHGVSGEEILGVCEQHTDALLELEPAVSTALLEELFAHLYRPERTYVHRWSPGDLVVWDNHALQHGRPEVGDTEPRTLRRVCVGRTQDLSIFVSRRR